MRQIYVFIELLKQKHFETFKFKAVKNFCQQICSILQREWLGFASKYTSVNNRMCIVCLENSLTFFESLMVSPTKQELHQCKLCKQFTFTAILNQKTFYFF